MGDRLANIHGACCSLKDMLIDFTTSSIWETKPLIIEDQPSFLNMVISGHYLGDENSLLGDIHRIEASLGRDRSKEIPKGPRTMDLDILIYSDLKIETETLSIPHPAISDRAFVLIPLLEIFPESLSSYSQYKEALEQIGDQGVECFIKLEKGQSIFKSLED